MDLDSFIEKIHNDFEVEIAVPQENKEFLREFFKEPVIRMADVYHVNELLAYDDEDFVKIIFKALLRRDPTPEDLADYCGKLRRLEFSKLDVITVVNRSKEAPKHHVQVEGAFLRQKLGTLKRILFKRIPVMKGFFTQIYWLLNVGKLGQKIEKLEVQRNEDLTRIKKTLKLMSKHQR